MAKRADSGHLGPGATVFSAVGVPSIATGFSAVGVPSIATEFSAVGVPSIATGFSPVVPPVTSLSQIVVPPATSVSQIVLASVSFSRKPLALTTPNSGSVNVSPTTSDSTTSAHSIMPTISESNPPTGTSIPPTAKTASVELSPPKNSLNTGAITGIVVGVVSLACLVAIRLFLKRRRNRTRGGRLTLTASMSTIDDSTPISISDSGGSTRQRHIQKELRAARSQMTELQRAASSHSARSGLGLTQTFSPNRRHLDAENAYPDLYHESQIRELSARMRQLEDILVMVTSGNFQGVNGSESPPEYVEGQARDAAGI